MTVRIEQVWLLALVWIVLDGVRLFINPTKYAGKIDAIVTEGVFALTLTFIAWLNK